jgi:hypothetical protein
VSETLFNLVLIRNYIFYIAVVVPILSGWSCELKSKNFLNNGVCKCMLMTDVDIVTTAGNEIDNSYNLILESNIKSNLKVPIITPFGKSNNMSKSKPNSILAFFYLSFTDDFANLIRPRPFD